MTPAAALKQGLKIARRIRPAVWVLFLINLGLAALATLPIYRGMLMFTGHSLVSQTLAHGFSLDWLTDFSFNHSGALDRYGTILMWTGLLSIPLNAGLAGGVLARFREPQQKFSLRDFFRDTGHYFWRLIRLMIIGLVCYWIVFRLFNQGLGNLIEKRTRDWLDDRPVFWIRLALDIVVVALLVFVNLVMDYARVKLIAEEGSSAIQASLASLGFCLGRLRKAFTVYAVPSLAGYGVLVIYLLLSGWMASLLKGRTFGQNQDKLLLALLFIGQQIVMFGRYWFRAATWASEWSYFRNWKFETRDSKFETRNAGSPDASLPSE